MQANSRLSGGFRRPAAGILAVAAAMMVATFSMSPNARASDDAGAGRDPGRPPGGVLRTRQGKVYFAIEVVQVDPNGLLFRHRNGTGKVLFTDLSSELQTHYGYDPGSAETFENGRPEVRAAADAADAPSPPTVLTFRVRTTLPRVAPSPAVLWAPVLCGHPAELGLRWPSHWSRFHHGHAYASFPWRQLAERDFLISSGLVPRPPGVRTWRLR